MQTERLGCLRKFARLLCRLIDAKLSEDLVNSFDAFLAFVGTLFSGVKVQDVLDTPGMGNLARDVMVGMMPGGRWVRVKGEGREGRMWVMRYGMSDIVWAFSYVKRVSQRLRDKSQPVNRSFEY